MGCDTIACLLLAAVAAAEFAPGAISDKRFGPPRHLDLTCDVSCLGSRFTSPEAWRARAAELREQVLASAGLLPMPERTPLRARIFGRIDRGDYTVEKVYFESFADFYVAGNLYRPKGAGPFPGVLNTHGHWHEGRFGNTEDRSIPARCISFARQGYVAFSYDMVGYVDSTQVPHRFSDLRERLWGISPGGLQLWNSIRALDLLESLPDVDRARLACTGASGGGTQTFLLCAVDDRVKVSAPVNMISAHMQGGCVCENLPNLRIDTDNVEIAATMAPRPMLMVSATGDWTVNTPTVEFPAVRAIYRILGAEDRVSCVQIDAGHNYNKDSREAVYSWFGRWLPEAPLPQPTPEAPFETERIEDLLVFPGGKLPNGALDQAGVVRSLKARSEAHLEAHKPTDGRGLGRFREAYRPALRRALSIPGRIDVSAEVRGEKGFGELKAAALILRDEARGAEVPAWLFEPASPDLSRAAIIVDEHGMQPDSRWGAWVVSLPRHGWRVLMIDCFGTGAHAAPQGTPERSPDKEFFDTYNRTDLAERVHDILVAAGYLDSRGDVSEVALVGSGKAGLWCLLAGPFAPNVTSTVADAAGLDMSSDDAFLDDLYVPCLRHAGDFRTAMALAAPFRLFVHNTQQRFDASWARAAYRAADCPDALKTSSTLATGADIRQWLESEEVPVD